MDKTTPIEPLIVGVGASAGGLEALSLMLKNLPKKIPFTIVIAQHLSPKHKSMMAEILTRESNRTVTELTDSSAVRSGCIYIVPPKFDVVFEADKIKLLPAETKVAPKPSINRFFTSLAEHFKEDAVGVVLSGTGSDGTSGLRAIQSAGGLSIVQEPNDAKYDGMPRSALLANAADFVLSAEEIGQRLSELTKLNSAAIEEDTDDKELKKLISIVKSSFGYDFEGYKEGTLKRRLKRRIAATGCKSIEEYKDYLNLHREEIAMLSRDLLISVTAFFRDEKAFEKLASAFRAYFRKKTELNEWRVWVAGCATGEEAFSVAILLTELATELGSNARIQVFATDLDERALQIARQGRFAKGILADVSPHLRERYFNFDGDNYEVTKKLRDIIVFAKHNVISDPPFMRVDFITCRNVLIYFDSDLQKRVLKRFHFAINEGGCLFLGRSESVGATEELFKPLDRVERLFVKSEEDAAHALIKTELRARKGNRPTENPYRYILKSLVENLGWAVIELTPKHRIKRSWGRVSSFFNLVAAESTPVITDMVIAPFRSELIALLHRFQKQPQVLEGRVKEINDEYWKLMLVPGGGPEVGVPLIIMRNMSGTEIHQISESNDEKDSWLYQELEATKAHLQSMLEELASSNEEMQSLNEETQASNEELQATNEELEAANEELQASNEELISLNQELSMRTQELAKLNQEYTHVYDALEFPLLVVNAEGRLQRFNKAAQRLFDLRQNMIHRDLRSLKLPSNLRSVVMQLFSEALDTGDVNQQWSRDKTKVVQITVAPGLSQDLQVETLLLTFVDVTDIASAHEQLKESQKQLEQVMRHTTVSLAMKDLAGHYSFVNPQFKEFFQVANDDLNGQTDFDLFPHEFAARVWEHDLQALRDAVPVTAEHTLAYEDGARRVFRMIHQTVTDIKGKPTGLLTEAEDITLRKSAEQQLKIAARVYEQAGEAIVVLDGDGIIQTVNSAFVRLSKISEQEAKNRSFWDFLVADFKGDSPPQDLIETLKSDGFWQNETVLTIPNVKPLSIWLTINKITSTDVYDSTYVAVFADISNLKESQRKVEYLATHDSLTELPNRTLFHDRLEHGIETAHRKKTEVGVLFIDLDNFKQINDTLGHDAGDELLIQTAERLKDVAREMDTVARLGGDEFTIILVESTVPALERVARKVIEELGKPFVIKRQRHYIGASVGIAIYPEDGLTAIELLKAADTAMYRAKENGRGRFELYKKELQSQIVRQTQLENDLRQAIENNELYLEFQPKFELNQSMRMVGAEALVRWRHPKQGLISPSEFIPVAESSNLIVDIDSYVARTLVNHMRGWREAGIKVPVMAINASPKSFQEEGYVDLLLRVLKQNELSSVMLQLELTERTLVSQNNTELGNIERLRNAGIQLSIDDFGTGYSSLSYLKRLPLAELKIDKSFVDGVINDPNDKAIARAILAMAKALKIRTVAEGVEDESQMQWLLDEGCDYAQGYYFSKPLSLTDFEANLKKIKSEDNGD